MVANAGTLVWGGIFVLDLGQFNSIEINKRACIQKLGTNFSLRLKR